MKAYNSVLKNFLALLIFTIRTLSAPLPVTSLPPVDSQILQDAITLSNLLARAEYLQGLYDRYGDRNPTSTTNVTMEYIMETLIPYNDYYDLTIGPYLKATDHAAGYNLCYQTKDGNQSNVVLLGAHYDAVTRTVEDWSKQNGAYHPVPGINDNGSGSMALLESALHLINFNTASAVRFCFWTLEEERAKICLYLNFDQIATKNGVHAVYNGTYNILPEDIFDESSPDLKVPLADGSRQAADFLGKYFTDHGHKFVEFEPYLGDDEAFVRYGIPMSGLSYGGEDPSYHSKGDNINNINPELWVNNAKAMAAAVAHFGTSLDEIPQRIGDMPNTELWKSGDD